jgi:hypothetical protein
MADENSNSTKKGIVEINTDSYNEATVLLERAYGVLDVIFTLENSNESTESLCRGSLSAAIDSAMVAINQANELLVLHGTTK